MEIKKTNETEEKAGDNTRIFISSGIVDFKERLQMAMNGLSGNAFAKQVGMSEAVIRDYLAGRTYPSLNRAAIIADKCNVPLEWLITGKGSSTLFDEEEATCTIPVYDLHMADCIGEKAVAMGAPPLSELPFDRSWINYRGLNKNDLVIFWAKGDSMEPTVANYDALVINTANKRPMDGYIFIVRYGDHLCTKRIQVRAKSLMLISDNNAYPPIVIDEDNDDFEIIGRVVYILKDIN